MKCVLKHKEVSILVFEYGNNKSPFSKIIDILSPEHMPLGYYGTSEKGVAFLNRWWKSRLIPDERNKERNVDSLMNDSLLYGFNLSDHYWIVKENDSMTWKKGNFFQNDFSEDMGKFITGLSKSGTFEMMSSSAPDLFSNGEQDKRWIIKQGVRILYKYGKKPYCQEPFNESLAAEICRRLKFDYVKYRYSVRGSDSSEIYSACDDFASENTEYIPVWQIMELCKKGKGESYYDFILRCCRNAGISFDVEKFLNQMFIVDYLTANVDRHFGNFGFLRNADSLEWISPAPIFDTGNSMFYTTADFMLENKKINLDDEKSKGLSSSVGQLLKKYKNKMCRLDLDFCKLDNLHDYYSNILMNNPNIDERRRRILCNVLKGRIESLHKELVGTEFIQLVKESILYDPIETSVKKAVKKIQSKSSNNQIVLMAFIKELNANSPEDLWNKIKKLF